MPNSTSTSDRPSGKRAPSRAQPPASSRAGKKAARLSVAELAAELRERVLEMEDGALLGSQEELLARYKVNIPTLRQAMAALTNEQLVWSRRGVNGGFFVRRPEVAVVTHAVAMYLRARDVDLSEQVATLFPVRIEIARRAARSRDETARAALEQFLAGDGNASVAVDFTAFNSAERQFNRLLARLSGSTTLSLFLEILLDLSAMVYREGDVFGKQVDRRRQYRTERNLLADAVLARDVDGAIRHAEHCSRLTLTWLAENHPELGEALHDAEAWRGQLFSSSSEASDASAPPVPAVVANAETGGDLGGAVDALRKLDAIQREIDSRRDSLEQAAALELGRAVIDGGGLALGAGGIARIVDAVVRLGPEEAFRRLG